MCTLPAHTTWLICDASLPVVQLRGTRHSKDELSASLSREMGLTYLVFGGVPWFWDEGPRLQELGCHAMTALQHLDVQSVAELSADDCRYLGTLRQLTTLELPGLGEVRNLLPVEVSPSTSSIGTLPRWNQCCSNPLGCGKRSLPKDPEQRIISAVARLRSAWAVCTGV